MIKLHVKYKNPTVLDTLHHYDDAEAYGAEFGKCLLLGDVRQLLSYVLKHHLTKDTFISEVSKRLVNITGASAYDYFEEIMNHKDKSDLVFDIMRNGFDLLDHACFTSNHKLYIESWDFIYKQEKQKTLIRLLTVHTEMISAVRKELIR